MHAWPFTPSSPHPSIRDAPPPTHTGTPQVEGEDRQGQGLGVR